MLCCVYEIGLDWPGLIGLVADTSQVHEEILEWNGERTHMRSNYSQLNFRG